MPRCQNGYRRNKKTGLCEKTEIKNIKKCPTGKVLNKKTNRCNNIKKTKKKICVNGKILNPITNRCIKNNTENKKKLAISNNVEKIVKPIIIPLNTSYLNNIFIKECSKYSKIKNIDLNKITISKGDLLLLWKNFKIIYNKTDVLSDIKFLSKGSYGSVYKYSNNDIQIALKTYNNKNDPELKIIRLLKKENIPCNIVNCKLLKNGSYYMAAMDLMNGPLSKIGNKLNNKNILEVIKTIAKYLKCLNDKGYSYTDLKTDNLLFKCIEDNKLKIVLGDVGGICKEGNQNPSTWLPWEARYLHGFPICNEKTMVWCLGVVIVELLNLNTNPFLWSNIHKYSYNLMKNHIHMISNHKKIKELKNPLPFSVIYERMMELDPQKRISLKSLIDSIK